MESEIEKEVVGKTSDGKDVYMFTLQAGKIKVRILNFGCVVKDILMPDKDGNISDVCLGYETFEGYEANPAYMGAICGRVANRIDGAKFTMDGKTYTVSKNDPLGDNFCHGGFIGLTRAYFNWTIQGTELQLTYTDVDGAEGFPGDVSITVTYELTEESGLMIDYKATTNKATPIDLSNHFMFNLAGHDGGYIGDHIIAMNSSQKLDFNDRFIPTGMNINSVYIADDKYYAPPLPTDWGHIVLDLSIEGALSNVEGTIMDARKPTRLGAFFDNLPNKDGLHFAHVLPGTKGEKKFVAKAEHPTNGRFIEVYTTEPVFISYSCYYLDFLLKGAKCKGGVIYQKSEGLLFMPQGYPDAVNQETFPSSVLRPGETYHTTSWYKFGVTTNK